MMPMYRYMDSHPEQRNQTFSFPQYPYPRYQPNPPMAAMPWPYGGNFGYSNPMACHSCCSHNAPSCNGFRPSYPQMPMPSPMHFAGGYPAPYHEAYPVPYVPPPHYSMELPKYEYDKNMLGSQHCCGCPNHSHQNANKGVKIEEQESPEVVQKPVNRSLIPSQMKNHPYPIVWIPAEEQRKITSPDHIGEQKKTSYDAKPAESLKSPEGNQRRGLFPFDMNNIGSLMKGGNDERLQDQRSEDGKREFPFPIFWMPSYNNKHDGAEKKDKDINASQDRQTEEQMKQLPFPFFWLPLENKQKDVGMQEEENEGSRKVDPDARNVPMKKAAGSDSGTRLNEHKSAALGVLEGKEKDDNLKVIPVKQTELPKEEDNSEDAKKRGREIPVKHADDSVGNKLSGSSVRSQSSSPKKSSKLPPVCLRVDPLPSKKKNLGGSSRSPSPPGHKNVQKESSADTTKTSSSRMPENLQQNQQPQDCISNNGKQVVPPKEQKVIEVVDKSENDSMHPSQTPVDCQDSSSKSTVEEASCIDENKVQFNEDQGTGKSGDKVPQNVEEMENANSVADGGNFDKKRLSDVAAAVRIQSACRGFLVRRWEPLKKLKQIADIRAQVTDIQNQITSLESSDLKKSDKQRVVIGETIMRLLLRLDSIQGLLPNLRGIRRSLARELVLLQEKLDNITSKKSQATASDVSNAKTLEELNANGNNVCMSEKQVEEVAKVGEEFPARVSDDGHVANKTCLGNETCNENVIHAMDSPCGDEQLSAGQAIVVDAEMTNGASELEQCGETPSHVDVEVPEVSEHKDLDMAPDNGEHELPADSDMNSRDLDSGSTVVLDDSIVDEQLNAGQAIVVDAEMTSGASELEQCGETPSHVEDKSDHSLDSTTSEISVDPELPQLEVGTEPAAFEPENVDQLESKNELKQGGEVGLSIAPDTTSPIETDNVTEKEAEVTELAALQLGTTDEDNGAVLEEKENEEAHTVKGTGFSESGNQETVSLQVDEEHKGDTIHDPEVDQHHRNKAGIDDSLQAITQTVECQPLRLPVETSTHDVVPENEPSDLKDCGDTPLSRVLDADMPNEDETEKSRGDNKEEVAVMQEAEVEAEESKNEQSGHSDAETDKENIGIEKTELLPASQIATEVSSGNGSIDGDEGARKLIEENEKLREMMQKLMAAGKDQLQVISNLTGRVQDLEKKLAKKKKLRTRRCRAATSRSCVKPSSNH